MQKLTYHAALYQRRFPHLKGLDLIGFPLPQQNFEFDESHKWSEMWISQVENHVVISVQLLSMAACIL